MKIEGLGCKTVRLGTIPLGGCFLWRGQLHLRIESTTIGLSVNLCNCAELSGGIVHALTQDTLVQPVTAKVVVLHETP